MTRRREPIFLSVNDVLEIHDAMLSYGGHPGILSTHLLESAVAMPYMMFGGEFLHSDISDMAAAYAFHLIRDHTTHRENVIHAGTALERRRAKRGLVGAKSPAFWDGYKRTGTAVMLAFLRENRVTHNLIEDDVIWLGYHIQDHSMTIDQIGSFLRAHVT